MSRHNVARVSLAYMFLTACFLLILSRFADARTTTEVLTGQAAQGDWTTDAPGVRRRLTVADLPAPYATKSVRNHPHEILQPPGTFPLVPRGFRVEKFADRLTNPRMIRTAPN